jgi:2,4-dienoyl-CoA reductase-like NADH-dependent reductase (Old Yellow Enzyme family)
MAPMTRRCADEVFNPTDAMIQYYAKRAEVGLIITEGTIISNDALGYGNVPGIFIASHIEKWKKITDAVHQNNGVIFLQLWHCGRISHPIFHHGQLPISASRTTLTKPLGNSSYTCGPSRAATISEIKNLVDTFSEAALNAKAANFDGIEIHGANGYLVDQFLHYCSNQREDEYGITPENMSRFCLEIITACGNAIGFERVGLRLSPGGHMNEIITRAHDQFVFQYLLQELEKLNIAYVHTGTFDDTIKYSGLNDKTSTEFLREYYKKNIIASGSYDLTSAEEGINSNLFDLIAFGRPFIANPDLIHRINQHIKLNQYDPTMLSELV